MPRTSATFETPLLDSVSTQDLYRELLVRIGEDPTRDGLLRTPERKREAWRDLLALRTRLDELLREDEK